MKRPSLRFTAAALLTCTLAGSLLLPVRAIAAESPPDEKSLLAEAKRLRQAADEVYRIEQAACYQKFLVNHCIDQAKQKRLDTIRQARSLEAEARQRQRSLRQQAAAETLDQQSRSPASTSEAHIAPADPLTLPEPGRPAEALNPPGSSTPATERRSKRAAAAEAAAASERQKRANRDAELAAKRAEKEMRAAERATAAERDRARYDSRRQQYEQEHEQGQP